MNRYMRTADEAKWKSSVKEVDPPIPAWPYIPHSNLQSRHCDSLPDDGALLKIIIDPR